MAINSFEICDKIGNASNCSPNSSKADNLAPCRLVKNNFARDGSVSSATGKRSKLKQNKDSDSPYLGGDMVQVLSRVTEKRLVHKKTSDFVSSFPLAVNIYKANSDEFKSLKRSNKKVRKSVLTLPNETVIMPELCTVSDVNDSEYFNRDNNNRKLRTKKRPPVFNNKKSRAGNANFEFYDRDARYCSQLNIDLDCSSTDMIKAINGDCKRVSNSKNKFKTINSQDEDNTNAHDVWAVLRNINRFQFRPSPPMSEDSIRAPKNKKGQKRRNKKDTRYVGTCRTEEFAYISSYKVNSKSPISFSRSSSFDRITVIDKKDDLNKICKAFEKRKLKSSSLANGTNNARNQFNNNRRIQNRNYPKNKTVAMKGSNFQVTRYNENNQKNKSLGLNVTKQSDDIANEDSLVSIVDIISLKKSNKMLNNVKAIDNTKVRSCIDPIKADSDFIYSGNSGSSKAAFNKVENTKTEKEPVIKVYSDESDLKRNPKVILSKGQELILSKRLDSQTRKLRLATTMPSACVLPKLTQTDIKRRLANMKFPIVVLGKDQLSSAVHVINDDAHLQFLGLDEHIWPFMLEWNEDKNTMRTEKRPNTKGKVSNIQKKNQTQSPAEKNRQKSQKINNEFAANRSSKFSNYKDKKLHASSVISKKTHELPPTSSVGTNKILQQPKKQTSICQFKDKMIKLLYKKSNIQNPKEGNRESCMQRTIKNNIGPNKVDVSTDTAAISNDLSRRPTGSPPALNKKLTVPKHPWAKAKWASDFIENVIKKIKNGVYYNHENKVQNRKFHNDSKEAAIQTPSTYKCTVPVTDNEVCIEQFSKVSTYMMCDSLKIIPGFENTLPALELKTLNMNQIAVKHCVTNITVQFDVAVPMESHKVLMNLNLTNSLSLIPLDVADSQTKIFKCKSIILNAMLPAELCSIVPKIMRNIIDSDIKLAIPSVPVNKTESHLSTISELTYCDSPDLFKSFISPLIYTSSELRGLLNGMFSKESGTKCVSKNRVLSVGYDCHLMMEMLPKLSTNELFYYELDPIASIMSKTRQGYNLPSLEKQSGKEISSCTTLQPYDASNRKVTPAFKRYDVFAMIRNIWSDSSRPITFNINFCAYDIHPINVKLENTLTLHMSMRNERGFDKTLALTINDYKTDSLYNIFPKTCTHNNVKRIQNISLHPTKCLKYIDTYIKEVYKKESKRNQVCVNNKTKRKKFGKLYRKCKSTSSISGERSCTLLSKITSLDDFFQALGMAKPLSSVLDSHSGQKILSSLLQMKNWITEINPSQALLVLLLTNKKDTPNLVRFRPILLQGIAVNRITRANELDMEIEVIEREHLYKLPQYEGISYLPASVENHDNLLEELYWIAKTTASDYQKPFDESSEKLLKSLLEKRKKLNPSYLRVMARYVGLGLLKSPCKK